MTSNNTFCTDLYVRDERIDFFRGCALLMIFVDHFESFNSLKVLSQYTLHSIGLCDAAEVFVFLSGYVSGISYQRTIVRSGFLASQVKAFKRAGELWIANMMTLIIALSVVIFFSDANDVTFAKYRVAILVESPLLRVLFGALQLYQPVLFDVLFLYMQLIVFLPMFLLGLQSRPWLTSCIACALYIVAQYFPWLNYPIYVAKGNLLTGMSRAFNPLAWQLLFFIGATLGRRSLTTVVSVPHVCVGFALAIVLGVAYMKYQALNSPHDPHGCFRLFQSVQKSPAANKVTSGPLRIVYLLALVLMATILPPKFRSGPGLLARQFIHCGKHSLPVFCFGVVLTYVAHPLLTKTSKATLFVVGYEFAGCASMFAFSALLSAHRRRMQAMSNLKPKT